MVEFIGILGINSPIAPVLRTLGSYDGLKDVRGLWAAGRQDGLDGAYVRGEAADMKGLGILREKVENTRGVIDARFYVMMDSSVIATAY